MAQVSLRKIEKVYPNGFKAVPQDPPSVASIGTDPLREPGSLLVRLIRVNTDTACSDGC